MHHIAVQLPPPSTSRTLPSPQEVPLRPLQLISFPTPSSWQPQVGFLSVFLPFPECHLNGTKQYVAFCVLLLLFSIMQNSPILLYVSVMYFSCVDEP